MEKRFKILPCGDSAVSVQFGERADIETNTKVRVFDLAVKEARISGVTETIPTYRAVMVYYDPLVIGYQALRGCIEKIGAGIDWENLKESSEVIRIPVWYTVPGNELEQVAEFEKKTPEEIIRIHTQSRHYVFMLGFSPGGSYIGCPDGSFHIPRKANPTMRPYSGSVGIQTDQSNISAFAGPSGWWSIGRTPVRSFDPRREQPILLRPGQWVEFYPVEKEEFEAIAAQVENMTYKPEIYFRD